MHCLRFFGHISTQCRTLHASFPLLICLRHFPSNKSFSFCTVCVQARLQAEEGKAADPPEAASGALGEGTPGLSADGAPAALDAASLDKEYAQLAAQGLAATATLPSSNLGAAPVEESGSDLVSSSRAAAAAA